MPCTCKKERVCISVASCSIPFICSGESNMFNMYIKIVHLEIKNNNSLTHFIF